MFSNLSFSSISLATETPSLVTVGAPNERSRTTLRPLGPSVVLTAFARTFTPRTMRTRASSPKYTCLAAMFDSLIDCLGSPCIPCESRVGGLIFAGGSADYCENFFFADHQQLFSVDFDGLTGIFTEKDFVADFQVNSEYFAIFCFFAWTNSNNFTL